jgi:hypothetical protein
MMSHNVEICKKEKKQIAVVTTKVTQPNQKPYNTSLYACLIYGLNGHKMIDCPKFAKMQKMFHGKFMAIAEVQPIVETQTTIIDI